MHSPGLPALCGVGHTDFSPVGCEVPRGTKCRISTYVCSPAIKAYIHGRILSAAMVGASHHSHSGAKGSVLTSTSSVQDADGNVHATTLRDRRNALTAEMIWAALNEASRDARELAEEVRASDEELRRNGIPFSERVGLLLPLRQRQLEKERQITALRELETAIARERLAHVDRTTCMCFLIPIVHNHSCTI